MNEHPVRGRLSHLRTVCTLFIAASVLLLQTAHACTRNDLVVSLDSSALFYQMLLNKAKTGILYAPPEERHKSRVKHAAARRSLDEFNDRTVAKLHSTVQDLSKERDTKLLFYGMSGRARCVWLIGASGEILSARLDEEAERAIDTVRETLGVTFESRTVRSGNECQFDPAPQARGSDDRARTAKHGLAAAAQYLLPPTVAAALARDPDARRLVVVPYQNLRSVPFAALPLGSSGLAIIDKYAVIVAPRVPDNSINSVKVPTSSRNIDVSRRSLVVGAPDLSTHQDYCWAPIPNALAEAKHVATRIGDERPLVGSEATFKTVRSRLNEDADTLRLIFFATHGVSNDVNPADKSFLALKDAHLRGADIRNLKKKFKQSPIVVMSACQTGLGKTFIQGMFGLIEAWQYAGASQVVASLWDVNDEGTALLMNHFADFLVASNFKDAEFALADAMRVTRRSNPDPSVWAAFSVYGEPNP